MFSVKFFKICQRVVGIIGISHRLAFNFKQDTSNEFSVFVPCLMQRRSNMRWPTFNPIIPSQVRHNVLYIKTLLSN